MSPYSSLANTHHSYLVFTNYLHTLISLCTMHYPYYMYFSSVSLLSRNTKFSSSPCTRSLHTSGKDTVLPNRRAIKDVSIVAPVLSDRTATNMHMAGVCLDRRGRRISVTGKDALSSSTRFDNKWDPYRFLGLTCPFMVNSARVLTCTIRGRTKKMERSVSWCQVHPFTVP